jgi:hypothetical protein
MSAYSDAMNTNLDEKIEKKIFGRMVSDQCLRVEQKVFFFVPEGINIVNWFYLLLETITT